MILESERKKSPFTKELDKYWKASVRFEAQYDTEQWMLMFVLRSTQFLVCFDTGAVDLWAFKMVSSSCWEVGKLHCYLHKNNLNILPRWMGMWLMRKFNRFIHISIVWPEEHCTLVWVPLFIVYYLHSLVLLSLYLLLLQDFRKFILLFRYM